MRKTISVAMTTYNGERFLREQLDSIYNQTLLPDEVVVCDDNSKDGTVAILEEYHKSKGLRFYVNNPGLGVNGNFHKAISLCNSDYIALSDQDDIWLKNKIEDTYKKLCEIDNGEPCAVSCQCDDIDSKGHIIMRRSIRKDTDGYADSLLGTGVSQGCTMMLNKKLAVLVLSQIEKEPVLNEIIYDALISHFAAIFGKKYNIMRSLMLYRHHEKNVLANNSKTRLSKKNRINSYGSFVGFVTDTRFVSLYKIYLTCKNEIADIKIINLLRKVAKIHDSSSFWKKMGVMLTISEISVSRKLSIAVKSIVMHVIKKLYKYRRYEIFKL